MENLVTDALLRRVRLRDVIHCVMMVLTILLTDGSKVFGVWLRLLTQIRTDIVQILHLFAFIVLYKTLIGTQMLWLFGVETVGDLVEHLVVDLVQHVVSVCFIKHIPVGSTTLSHG